MTDFPAWFSGSAIVDRDGRPLRAYHGTGNLEDFDRFKPELTGLGNDQFSSGFYFTTDPIEASGYATHITPNAPEGARKLGGDSSPGIVAVYLSIKNPIRIDQHGHTLRDATFDVTQVQAERIIRKCPTLFNVDESPLTNWEDIQLEGISDRLIREVAGYYCGPKLIELENDFFRHEGGATEFRHVLRDVLGHDGVIVEYDDNKWHVVAWFPEQIRFAWTVPAHDLDMDTCPRVEQVTCDQRRVPRLTR